MLVRLVPDRDPFVALILVELDEPHNRRAFRHRRLVDQRKSARYYHPNRTAMFGFGLLEVPHLFQVGLVDFPANLQ